MVLQAVTTILFFLFLFGILALQWLNLRVSARNSEAATKSAETAHEAVATAREAVAVAKRLAERQT